MARKRMDQESYGGSLATTEPPPLLAASAGAAGALEPAVTMPSEPHTMAEILEDLIAFEDTLAMAETEDIASEISMAIAERQQRLIAKVDRFAAVMRRMEHEAAWEKAEAARHTGRMKRYQSAYERMEGYAVATMQNQNVRKLDGQGAALKLRAGTGSVLITDEQAVPSEYKTVTVTMPLDVWNSLMVASGVTGLVSAKATISVQKEPVKKAIKAGEEVPGADIHFDDHLVLE